MTVKLWSETNKTEFSSIFTVPAFKVCLLFGTRFALEKYRADPTEFVVPQMVCVRRVLHGFTPKAKKQLHCDWVFDIDAVKADKIEDEVITTCSAPWQLSACRNIGVIGLPGSYRLELNDPTAVGIVQVYAELYDANMFPTQVADVFFS